MNTIDFCFWLQGYFEIADDTQLTDKQVEVIRRHLSLVFKHEIDPLRESETTTPPLVLNATHSGSHVVSPEVDVSSVVTPPFPNDTLYRC